LLEAYVAALASAPLAEQSRRTYASKVRQYLAWLAATEDEGDPLGSAAGRDWAVRDYRAYLQTVLKRSPATLNAALAAADDFYMRRGLGPASAKRAELAATAPRRSASGPRSGSCGPWRRTHRPVTGRWR
jgi:integrase/recombinase XerC